MVSAQTAGNDQSYTDENEAGAQDNLLSVNPNDPEWKDELATWKDDTEYPIPTGTMRQISPGEFAIVKAKFKAAPVEEAEAETPAEDAGGGVDEGAAEQPPEPPMSKNPAMDNYLKRKYARA